MMESNFDFRIVSLSISTKLVFTFNELNKQRILFTDVWSKQKTKFVQRILDLQLDLRVCPNLVARSIKLRF